MTVLDPSRRLKKQLSLLDVYAICTGATLSSGFFLLPGIAAREAGPAVILTYLIAAIPLLPGIASKIELSTAMPRAGGVYYFLDRSMGPLFGCIGGLGTWLTLALKVSFALVGMGAYLRLVWQGAPIELIAVTLAILFGILNVLGARKTGGLQTVMVVALLGCLGWFVGAGPGEIDPANLHSADNPFFGAGAEGIFATAGLVCVSYIGLTKVASVSEEVRDPERSLPRAMFLALLTAVIVYGAGTFIMVGVLPADVLYSGAEGPSYTPVADTARVLGGSWGMWIMTGAALLAFFSVANAGILSASRYPLAMGRDHLMPPFLHRLGRFGTPTNAIVLTVVLVIGFTTVFNPLNIAKLAGAFQLMLFAFNCLAVIVMRESKIESYDPGYRAPWYPWLQIFGIIGPLALIVAMGWLPILFTAGLIVIGVAWFMWYARDRVERHGAIYHVFERLGRRRAEDLDRELRGILKEKGLREQDPFVEIVARAWVINVHGEESFEQVAEDASRLLARRIPSTAPVTLMRSFLEGTRIGATPVSNGAALPHIRMSGIDVPEMVVVRATEGIEIVAGDVLGERSSSSTNYAIFFLVSPDDDPGQHLRLLAELASRIDQEDFLPQWRHAPDEQRLKEILLRHERYIPLVLAAGTRTESLINREIRDLELPRGCLVAVIRREGEAIVPGGDTTLLVGDQLAVIGSEAAIRECGERFAPQLPERGEPERQPA
ncbi:MAG: amino acid permease [Planctomycetota bacterium]|jgi:amino acid transporter/mannitol/fructose-specific phosphotransferase system IIA component (Ntr-type)